MTKLVLWIVSGVRALCGSAAPAVDADFAAFEHVSGRGLDSRGFRMSASMGLDKGISSDFVETLPASVYLTSPTVPGAPRMRPPHA